MERKTRLWGIKPVTSLRSVTYHYRRERPINKSSIWYNKHSKHYLKTWQDLTHQHRVKAQRKSIAFIPHLSTTAGRKTLIQIQTKSGVHKCRLVPTVCLDGAQFPAPSLGVITLPESLFSIHNKSAEYSSSPAGAVSWQHDVVWGARQHHRNSELFNGPLNVCACVFI